MSKVVEQKLVSHMESDERDFGYLKETMARIEASQHKAETNHWAHVQASTGALEEKMGELTNDMSTLAKSVTELAADIGWIKKFFWIVAGSSVGALVTGILKFVILAD